MHRVSFLALSCIMVTQLACADDVCLGDDCPLGTTCSVNGTCVPSSFTPRRESGQDSALPRDYPESTFDGTTPPLTGGTLSGDFGGRTGFKGEAEALWGEVDYNFQFALLLIKREQQPIGGAMIMILTNYIDLQDLPVGRTVFSADDPYHCPPIMVFVASGEDAVYFDDDERASGEVIVTERDDGTHDVEIYTRTSGGERAYGSFSYTL